MTTMLFAASEPGSPSAADSNLFRIISEPMISKNQRVRLIGCGPAGRLSLALRPSETTPETQPFLNLQRGDLIRVTGAYPREGGLDLVPGSRVEVLLRGYVQT